MTFLTLRNLAIRGAVAAVLASQISAARCESVQVTIDNFTFAPAALSVKVGTTVTWKNQDDIPHTVVSAGKFKSKALDADDSFSFTFTSTGDYTYFCSLHPHMTGTIKVE
jgi:plastocyanin